MLLTDLFDAARHEPLTGVPWSDAAAQAAIARIVASTLAEYEPGQGWLTHPLDDPETPDERVCPLYHGAGGVVLALRFLAQRGAAVHLPDFTPLVAGLYTRHHPLLADARHGSASWLLGDVGIDLLHWTLAPEEALLQRLHASILGNLHNTANEALWGNPGTVLGAIHLAQTTGQPRWASLVRQAADALEASLVWDEALGAWLWVQDLYGRPGQKLLGAGHGFVGNVFPFLRGAALLPPEQVDRMLARALQTLQATAQRAEGAANWAPNAHPDPSRPRKMLVQDCHGAPGVLCRLASAPRTPEWDQLLSEAGELTWRAGPLAKGASLCHGTGGSALALLKLWRRTGDALWRARARALAMHAAGQVERHRAQYGQGRHSLWTGDLGAACILQACIEGDDAFPSLDSF